MERLIPIRIEWNHYNGFMFDILQINDVSLFGISIGWNSYVEINLFWFAWEIWTKKY
jgi:hypothetical protein